MPSSTADALPPPATALPLLPPPAAVLFDLDGTLVDSLPTLRAIMDGVLADLGRSPIPLPMLRSFVGDGVARLVERVLETTGGVPSTGLGPVVDDYLKRYERSPAEGTRLADGCVECLDAFAGAGVKLAVCTNKPETVTAILLRDLGIADRFDAVVGGDTCATRKPDAEPALEACRRLGVEPKRTLFVGDNEHDTACGRSAGCSTVVILSGGYARVPLDELGADRIVRSLSEVPPLFGL